MVKKHKNTKKQKAVKQLAKPLVLFNKM